MRAYTPRTEPGFKERVEDAFQRWCRRYFGSNTQMATPARKPQQQQQPEALTAREVGKAERGEERGPEGGEERGEERGAEREEERGAERGAEACRGGTRHGGGGRYGRA